MNEFEQNLKLEPKPTQEDLHLEPEPTDSFADHVKSMLNDAGTKVGKEIENSSSETDNTGLGR